MNNGISDWSPLSGDPGCTESLDEWAGDMLDRIGKLSIKDAVRLMADMTDDERDIIRESIAKEGRTA